ncbi:MAG: hypothetical protein QOH68_3926 [Nocardioidaceae bacterium]|nr:hypothetical protein [Nocardioidaceae bacterium]
MTEMTVKPVIHVGVDGSWRDTGALEWALLEAPAPRNLPAGDRLGSWGELKEGN